MRVVIWTDAFLPEIGGMEVFCLRLAEGLLARRHACLVVANCDEERAARHNDHGELPVRRFAFHQTLNRADLRAFRHLVDECDQELAAFAPDVVQVNVCNRSVMPLVLCQRRRPRPAVLTLHDRHVYRHDNILVDELLDSTESVTAVSEFIRGDALDHKPNLASKIRCISNCLPLPASAPAPLPDTFCFMTVGRLIHDKGFDLAIEAFASTAQDFPECKLVVVGDGHQRDALRALANARLVADRVQFLGARPPDEIPALLNQASVVLVPSRWEEPFGLVALQAAQMGRAVCAARSGGLPEIAMDGVTGWLFESGSVPSAAHTMRKILLDPAEVRRRGERARERALANFSFEKFLDQYESELQRVASGSALPAEANR